MMYQIKRVVNGNAITVATAGIRGSFSLEVMGEDLAQGSFELSAPVAFEIGDFIIIKGRPYFMNTLDEPLKSSSNRFSYNVRFEGLKYELIKVQYLMLGATNGLEEPEFSLMGNALTHIDLLVRNLNRVQSGWTIGVVDITEVKNIPYSSITCLAALTTLAEEFNLEFYVDGDKSIHLTKRSPNSGVTLRYGQNNGFKALSRTNVSSVFTRVFAFGSERNLPANYRNYSKKLKIPASAGLPYVEANTDKYGVIEAPTLVFDDLYPHRICKVTAVDANSIYRFSDATIDFDVNQYLLPGITAKVTFNTGQLAGYTFDLSAYNSVSKQFTINKLEQEKALELPSSLLGVGLGDEFVVTDITMPTSYIEAEEAKVLARAQDWLAANSNPRVQYVGEVDQLAFKNLGYEIEVGANVQLIDADLNVNTLVRARKVVYDLETLLPVSYDFSESVRQSAYIREYLKDDKTQAAIKLTQLTSAALARRAYQDKQELIGLVFDAEGNYYTGKIKPASIETSMLQVGARSQQFELIDMVVEANAMGNVNRFKSSTGVIDHFTIDPLAVKSWNISATDISGLGNHHYYIYIKAEKAGSNATVVLTPAQITVNQDSNYYHFWAGVLHSPNGGVRGISLTYGQTTVNGKFITTGKVQSQDGLTYFDLDAGEIGGKIKIGNNGTSTIIDGNLVTSGTMVLGNGITDNAGVSGDGTLTTSTRFWAGASYSARNTAPFRVDQSGKLWASDAEISGTINATSGTIGGFQISATGLGLNGAGVKINPAKGINVYGLLSIPKVAPNAADMEAGQYYIYIDEAGLGGNGVAPTIKLTDLSDVTIGNTGYVLTQKANGTFAFMPAAAGGVSSWNQLTDKPTTFNGFGLLGELQNYFNGSLGIQGYNKANWDAAFGWGNHSIAGYALASGSNLAGYNPASWNGAASLAHSHANKAFLDSMVNGASVNLNVTSAQVIRGFFTPGNAIEFDYNSANTFNVKINGGSPTSVWPINIAGSSNTASYASNAGNATLWNGYNFNDYKNWLGLGSGAFVNTSSPTNWVNPSISNNVVRYLGWKNYGDSHVIFDASQGTSPTGSAINNVNSDVAWQATFPTLMGWNGANTYGLRVDTARYAESAGSSHSANLWGNRGANFDAGSGDSVQKLAGFRNPDGYGVSFDSLQIKQFLGMGSAAIQNWSYDASYARFGHAGHNNGASYGYLQHVNGDIHFRGISNNHWGRSDFYNDSSGWVAATFRSGQGSDKVVIGNLNGLAHLGAHTVNLDAWANLFMQRDAGNVIIGGSSDDGSKLQVSGNISAKGTYPYLQLHPNHWSSPLYIQSGVSFNSSAAGDYVAFQVPNGKGYTFNVQGVPTLVIDTAKNIYLNNTVRINNNLQIPEKNTAGNLTGNYWEIYIEA